MKKHFSLWASIALILSILVGTLSPLVVSAQDAKTTTVHIHKLQMAQLPDELKKHDGANKSLEELKAIIGTDVQFLDGVKFQIQKLADDTDMSTANPKTVTGEEVGTKTTAQGGLATFEGLADGKYVVKEIESPNEVSGSLGVPFLLELPLYNAEGNQRLAEVHLYPKNETADVPEPHKSVNDLTTQSAGQTIGKEFNWFLKATIPTNIGKYESFEMTDKLSDSLTYQGIGAVKVGDTTLVRDVDYTVTGDSVGTDGANIAVALTAAGMQKIAGLLPSLTLVSKDALPAASTNTNAGAFLSVELKATINEKAVLGTPIKNQFTLKYDNTPGDGGNPKEKPSNEPEVYTGGHKFVKVDGKTETKKLADAEFELYLAATNEPIKWTAQLLKANPDKVDGAVEGETVKVKSKADGSFVINGLTYNKDTGTTYYLKETKAPAGYVKPSDDTKFEFTVTATSHNETSEALTIKNNQQPNIPNTGGIGSVIFVVIGLGLMATAVYGYKRYAK